MESVAFNFLNNHVGRRIMAVFLDDNVKMASGSICERMVEREHEESLSHMN